MTPYYADDLVTIYHGDCREVMDGLGEFDVVFADPPYGVGKAAWDQSFDLSWSEAASRLAPVLAITPGVWNLAAMPTRIGSLNYRWTLAAHLRNGRGGGRLGRGNWIPCVIYSRDEEPVWTQRFAQWCRSEGIKANDLDAMFGTNGMGGHWTTTRSQAAIPTPMQWATIRRLGPPADLDELVYAGNEMEPGPDSASFVVATEPMPDHPSPKPLTAMRWLLDRIPGYRLARRGVLDPFMGSGTTLVAAKEAGRRAVGIEINESYCEVAAERLSQQTLSFLPTSAVGIAVGQTLGLGEDAA